MRYGFFLYREAKQWLLKVNELCSEQGCVLEAFLSMREVSLLMRRFCEGTPTKAVVKKKRTRRRGTQFPSLLFLSFFFASVSFGGSFETVTWTAN